MLTLGASRWSSRLTDGTTCGPTAAGVRSMATIPASSSRGAAAACTDAEVASNAIAGSSAARAASRSPRGWPGSHAPWHGQGRRLWIDGRVALADLDLVRAHQLLHQVAADVARADDRAPVGSRIAPVTRRSTWRAWMNEVGPAPGEGAGDGTTSGQSARRARAGLPRGGPCAGRGSWAVGSAHARTWRPRSLRADLEVARGGATAAISPASQSRFIPPNDSNVIAQTSSGILTAWPDCRRAWKTQVPDGVEVRRRRAARGSGSRPGWHGRCRRRPCKASSGTCLPPLP